MIAIAKRLMDWNAATQPAVPMGMRPRVKTTQAELDEIVRLHTMYQTARPGGQRA